MNEHKREVTLNGTRHLVFVLNLKHIHKISNFSVITNKRSILLGLHVSNNTLNDIMTKEALSSQLCRASATKKHSIW